MNLELWALFLGVKVCFIYQKYVSSELHFSMILWGNIFAFLVHTVISKCGLCSHWLIVSVQMCGLHFLWTGKLNVYFRITRKLFEVDCLNGINFLLKKYDSLLRDYITKMEFWNFFICRLLICSRTYLPSYLQVHTTPSPEETKLKYVMIIF